MPADSGRRGDRAACLAVVFTALESVLVWGATGVASNLLVGATASAGPASAPTMAAVRRWTSIGPAPLAYAHGPTNPANLNSGRVALADDPSDASHWLAGAGNGTVWRPATRARPGAADRRRTYRRDHCAAGR